VYDAEGKPQRGAELRFQDRNGYGGTDDEKHGMLARSVSDANGYYEARHVPAHFCYVQRDDPWRSWGTVRHAIQTTNGKTHTLDFGGTTKLSGRLIVNGTPVVNARVQFSGENPDFGIYKAYAKSDQKGAFTFWGTPPGQRTLYYTTSQQSDSWVRVKDIESPRGDMDLGDLQFTAATLSVRVENAAGTNIDGAQMRLQEFDPKWPHGNSVGRPLAHSSPQNPYVFAEVPPGKYELIYSRPNHFAVRQTIEITPDNTEQFAKLQIPVASASLSGKLALAICGPDGCQSLNIWSTDQRFASVIMPANDGTYHVANIPAGDYIIREADTRDGEALMTVTLRQGEDKKLDITPDTIAHSTKPVGFAILEVFTSEGVLLPGCNVQFDDATNAPGLNSEQDGRMHFVGTPGVQNVTISYPGFNPLQLKLDLKPVGEKGRPIGNVRTRVELVQAKN
jgi:hypothetical protein